MMPWAFLILIAVLAFVAGFASCYMLLRQLAKVYGRIMGAIGEVSKHY